MAFDKARFFDACRKGVMGPVLDQDEVTGAELIVDAMAGLPISWVAYALATAWHETAHSMKPRKEIGSRRYFTRLYDVEGQNPGRARRMGNRMPGDGPKYCGRGFVQLTWKDNYSRAGKELGVDLARYPDKAMEPGIAADVMRLGMCEGWFTGKALKHYLPESGWASIGDFRKARRIINGTDKATQIARYALEFQRALAAGGWE